MQPSLAGLAPSNPYSAYLTQVAPFEEEFDSPLADDPKERHPVLQRTGWDEHLSSFTSNRAQLAKLRDIVKIPSPSRQGLGLLANAVDRFMRFVRRHALDSSFAIRTLLMRCPRSVFFSVVSSVFFSQPLFSVLTKPVRIGKCIKMTTRCAITGSPSPPCYTASFARSAETTLPDISIPSPMS